MTGFIWSTVSLVSFMTTNPPTERFHMYVADITDRDELIYLLAEIEDRLLADPDNEQARWDREDILDRMDELMPMPKLERLRDRPSPFAQ